MMGKRSVEDIFAGDSEIAVLMRSHFAASTENADGLQTLMGAVETWSSSLKNAFGILLNSCCPIFLVWDCNPIQSEESKRILFYNDAYLALLKEVQHLIPFGRSVKESWTEDWSHIQSDVEQVFRTGQALRRENKPLFSNQKSNNGGHLYTWSYSAIWDETDRIRGVFATGCPVTANVEESLQERVVLQPSHPTLQKAETRQTEAALRESEARFQAFMSHSPTSAWIADRDGRILYLSPTYFQMFQFSQQDAVGKHIHEIYNEEFAKQFLENNRYVFETGQVIESVETAPKPDGSIGSFLVYKFPIAQDTGETLLGGIAVDITERKQTEQALRTSETLLRQSEERLRLAMTGAQMGTWDVDLVTGKAFWSEQHFTMLGYEPVATGEASEEMWGSRIHPDDLEQVIQEWQQSRQEKRFYRAEYRVVRADNGQIAWLLALGNFIYNQSGLAIRSIGVLFDISERKKIEMALLAQEQRYRYIFEAVGVSIWEEDFSEVKAAIDQLKTAGVQDFRQYFIDHPEFVQQAIGMVRLQDVNQASLQLFGAQNKAELLNSLHQVFVSETYDTFIEELLKVAAEETHFAAETTLQNLQGKQLHVWLNITFPAPSESYDRVLVSILDITARKRAETAVQESEERLRLALMAANQGLYDLNVQTGDAIVSPEYPQMLGYSPDEFQETNAKWRDRLHPEDKAVVYQVYEDYIAGKLDMYRVEFRQRTQSGDWKWILSVGKIVSWDNSGQPLRMLGTHTDITERKQVEAEREQLLVREQAAREQAETANRIKDQFLAVLSHELRSPLNPILGWAKLLQARQFDESATKRALETIERNAKLQTQLIDDLLDIGRILRGKMVLNVRPLDLENVIDAALETVRLSSEAKGIEIRKVVTGNIGQFSGDADRLQQIVWNLLSNAVKFTPNGGQIEIRLERVGSDALIQVKDMGKGIKPEFLPYVFESFRQEDNTTTRKFGGLGLGLAIVRYLTELHGGTVKAESPGEGLGATFTVVLPISKHGNKTSDDESEISNGESTPFLLTEKRILVVDDEADMRELIFTILEQTGAEIKVTSSAIEALDILKAFKPHILISDIGMPSMDGYELLRQIRRLPPEQSGRIPAIALSAYAGEINQQQALAAGFQQHIAKPVEPQELVTAIGTLIQSQ